MNLQETSKRFKLDDKNLETMLNLLDDLTIEMKTLKKNRMYHLEDVTITTIDGTDYELPVYIDSKFDSFAGLAFDRHSPIGVDNIALVVNPKFSASKKNLYNSLYHEFLHAIDPTLTSKPSEKYMSKYADPNENPDLYYSHGIELRGITGEFFEALVNEFRERLSNIKDSEDREIYSKSLDNIVSFFNEMEPLSPMSFDILDSMEGQRGFENKSRQVLNKILKDYPKTSEFLRDTPENEPYYLQVIDDIRFYSPKGWKMFLNMLYSTKKEITKMIENKIVEGKIKHIIESRGTLSSKKLEDTPYPQFIRDLLKKIYKPLGNYYAKNDPENNCITNEGVWDVYPHSETDRWSLLNKFDTNTRVKDRMLELFYETEPESFRLKEFMDWIEENFFDLLLQGGKYTDELVELNRKTSDRGMQNEDYAMSVLKEKYPGSVLKRFCSGDIRDTKKGMDIEIEYNGRKFHVQVKPFIKITKYMDQEDTIYYEVNSEFKTGKYGERTIQLIMFVNYDSKEYILFNNKKAKIGEVRAGVTRFYEEPLTTNMSFPIKPKRIIKSSVSTQSSFGVEDKTVMLSDLETKKAKLEKLIVNLRKSIQSDNSKKQN